MEYMQQKPTFYLPGAAMECTVYPKDKQERPGKCFRMRNISPKPCKEGELCGKAGYKISCAVRSHHIITELPDISSVRLPTLAVMYLMRENIQNP
jgi:hypothetical protein